MGQRSSDPQHHTARPSQAEPHTSATPATGGQWPPSSGDRLDADGRFLRLNPTAKSPAICRTSRTASINDILKNFAVPLHVRPVSPFSQALVPSDSTRGRRAQDDFDYQQSQGFPERRSTPEASGDPGSAPSIAQPGRSRRTGMALCSVRAPGHAQTYPPDIACTVFCRRYLAALSRTRRRSLVRAQGCLRATRSGATGGRASTPERDPHAGSRSVLARRWRW